MRHKVLPADNFVCNVEFNEFGAMYAGEVIVVTIMTEQSIIAIK